MLVRAENWMVPDLISLWKLCFGDTEEYIALFMARRFRSNQALVWLEGEHPVGAAYFLPCRVGITPALYGYAVGVAPEFRGRGVCTSILSAAERRCEAEGMILLVAPREGVSDYYHRRGYQDAFFCRWMDFGGEGTVLPLLVAEADEKTYMLLRDGAFYRTGFVRWCEADIAYALTEKRFCGGFVHCLTWEGKEYLLFGHRENESLVLEETTLEESLLARLAPSLCAHYGVKKIRCRLPAGVDGEPVGCCRGAITWNVGWLGLELT